MDTAAMAAASDPQANRQFSRRWTGPPPKNRKRPGASPQAPRANFEVITNQPQDSVAERSVQRALERVRLRAARLDRTADLLLALGKHAIAERLSHRAAELRAVAA
jgi:hypothetical protein